MRCGAPISIHLAAASNHSATSVCERRFITNLQSIKSRRRRRGACNRDAAIIMRLSYPPANERRRARLLASTSAEGAPHTMRSVAITHHRMAPLSV